MFCNSLDSLKVSPQPRILPCPQKSVNVWTWRRVNFRGVGENVFLKNERERIGQFIISVQCFLSQFHHPVWRGISFPLLTIGVREATHKLCMLVCTVYSAPSLTHVHTNMESSKGHSTYTLSLSITYGSLLSWLWLFFFLREVLFFSHHNLSSSLFLCFYFTWIGFFLAEGPTNTFSQFTFCQYSVILVQKHLMRIFLNYTQRKTLSPWLLLLCFQPSSWSSSAELLSLPPPPPQLPLSASQDAMRETAERIRELEKALRESMNTSAHREALWAQEEGARVQAQRKVYLTFHTLMEHTHR